MHNISSKLRLFALGALLGQSAVATPIITAVVETGGDNEATDTIAAKWTGVTFPISIANEPVPGAVIGNSYTAGAFLNHAPCFVDRNHRFTNALEIGAIPAYLVGQEYIMSGNDNRDNAAYTLDITVDRAVDAYMLIDNRLGDLNSTNPPTFGPTNMQWIVTDGWVASSTGANRTRNIALPDELAIDEGADGTINQYYSIFKKTFPAGTFRVKQADNAGQNMYGVVVTPAVLGRVVTVNTTNNFNPSPSDTSLQQALTGLQDGDIIRFNLPGAGPHYIETPLGGYPLISANNVTIDGYSQPGSVPNINPILGGNNARIDIVLDSTGADSGPSDPQAPTLNARRSTRIMHSGYGDSENGMLAIFGGDNFTVRGLSFIARRTAGSVDDPSIYGVALVNQATNARVQGCWFGLAPGGSAFADVKPPASAVAGFRYRTGGDVYSSGLIAGTDGDGVTDRAEFNVMIGGRITLALELPAARIAGNYLNLFPNGMTFLNLDSSYQQWRDAFSAGGSNPDDVTIENYENGRITEGSVIGTNGDGVSDSDERNIFGHTVYGSHGEFYSSSLNAVLAGNYFGVSVDGVTPAPLSTNATPDFVEFGGPGQVRVGSNGDGISDDVEGNLIVNVPGSRYVMSGSTVPIVSRLNKLVNDTFKAVPFADGENSSYVTYYTPYLANSANGVAPVLTGLTNGVLSGTFPAASATYPNVLLDFYTADPAALSRTNNWPAPTTLPLKWLTSLTDNSPADLDPTPNAFRIDLNSFGAPAKSFLTASASYSQVATSFNATNAVTSPMSNPISTNVTLAIRFVAPLQAELSWIAPQGLFAPEYVVSLSSGDSWFPITSQQNYTSGRTTVLYTVDAFTPEYYFRLVPQ